MIIPEHKQRIQLLLELDDKTFKALEKGNVIKYEDNYNDDPNLGLITIDFDNEVLRKKLNQKIKSKTLNQIAQETSNDKSISTKAVRVVLARKVRSKMIDCHQIEIVV